MTAKQKVRKSLTRTEERGDETERERRVRRGDTDRGETQTHGDKREEGGRHEGERGVQTRGHRCVHVCVWDWDG